MGTKGDLSSHRSTEDGGSLCRLKVRRGPAGLHFFERSTGTNLLLDEARVPPVLWSKAPRIMSIALTTACDLCCRFCYAPNQPVDLEVELLRGWLDELDQHGCLGVGFGGGEPTLSRHLSWLCRYITSATGMSVSFTTHGHRFTDSLAAELSGTVHFIRLSMDGVGSTYERLRGASFTALLGQIPRIRSVASFGINFVVNEQTFPDLDEAVALATHFGAAEFLLLPEQPVQNVGGIDRHTKELLREWVAVHQGPLRLAVSEEGAEGLPICDPLAMEPGLRAYAHIDASGSLKRSSYDPFGVPIGAGGVLEAMSVLKAIPRSRP